MNTGVRTDSGGEPFYDTETRARVRLHGIAGSSAESALELRTDKEHLISLTTSGQLTFVTVSNNDVDASLSVAGRSGGLRVSHKVTGRGILDTEKGTVELNLSDGAPSLRLSDRLMGHPSSVLGHSGLVETRTGIETKRPASSLVLFDRDGKVIWKAP